jgi:hypothetical protein
MNSPASNIRSFSLIPLAVAVAASPVGEVAAQQPAPPVQCGFEEPDYHAGSIDGQHGWSLQQGRAEIVSGEAHGGQKALKLFPADPFSQAKLSLSPGVPPSAVMFVDFFVVPAPGALSEKEEFLDIDGARIGLFRETDDAPEAVVYFFHGNGAGSGEWISTGAKVVVHEEGAGERPWVRITVREDFARQTWDLWVDGKPVAGDAGFQEPNMGHTQNYIIMGDAVESVLLDDVSIAAANPYGPDADLDGLVDSLEKTLGFNPLFDDRDADKDGDGVRNLEEALLSAAGNNGLKINAAEALPSAPVFSVASGVASASFDVGLSGAMVGGRILVTTDGSDPRSFLSGATAWDGPRRIERTTVLRAVAVDSRGRVSPTATAAWVFPATVASQERPAGVPAAFRDIRFNGSQEVDFPMSFAVRADDGLAASLASAPVVVVSAGSSALFGAESGLYSRASQKRTAAAAVMLLDPSGQQAPAASEAVISISGESSRYHDVTAKHSIRLRFAGRDAMTGALTGAEGPTGSQILLRHPTHDSWTVDGIWAQNRQDAKYFADCFASRWMGDAGHLTLRRRWVHVFLDASYWGVYEAIEQHSPDPAGVSDLLEAGQGQQVEPIFGEVKPWRELHARLRDLSILAMNGTVEDAAWRAAAAAINLPSLVDYILLNCWMTNLDWPEHNYLIARRAGQWNFVSWDAEWSMRRSSGAAVDMSARLQGAGDGPAFVFSSFCWWPEFRSLVSARLTAHIAAGGMLHPGSLAARVNSAADDFRSVLPAEAARWGTLMAAAGAQAHWESHLAWLQEEYVPVRTATVSSHLGAVLEQFARRATDAELMARERAESPAELIAAPFRPQVVIPETNGDSDGDGIPDEWELSHGLDPRLAADGALDSDGDGLSNLTEYLLGRDSGRFEPVAGVFAVEPSGVGSRLQVPKVRLGQRINLLGQPLSPAEAAAAIAEEAREAESANGPESP